MLDPSHPVTPFFDDDPDRVLASLPAIAASSGKVHSLDTLFRRRGELELRGHRGGLFDPGIFGPSTGPASGRFGHIDTGGVVHPSVFPRLVEVLQLDTPDIVAMARGEKVLRGDRLVDDGAVDDPDDLSGPRGVAEAVRRRAPEHPLLPLCAIKMVPVPPLAARPMRKEAGPEAIDPWMGPVNEAWLRLVERAGRELRIYELDAPPIVCACESVLLQRAFEDVIHRMRRAEAKLVPEMLRGVREEAHVIAIAFAGPERIVIQRGTGIRITDLSGRDIRRAAPSGCTLRGVVDGHLAVLHEFRQGLHPSWTDAKDLWPPAFVERGVDDVVASISVVDVDTGEFLSRAPDSVPRTFVENDEPEDLFLGERKLYVGGDRPSATAYSHDLRFARVSGESTEIISLANGSTVSRPAQMFPDEVEIALDLATGARVAHEWDDTGGGAACAIAFVDGRWFTLDDYGVLCDHLGNDAIAIVPPPAAAAFDPSGARLAVIFDDELVIIDRVTHTIVGRFPA